MRITRGTISYPMPPKPSVSLKINTYKNSPITTQSTTFSSYKEVSRVEVFVYHNIGMKFPRSESG